MKKIKKPCKIYMTLVFGAVLLLAGLLTASRAFAEESVNDSDGDAYKLTYIQAYEEESGQGWSDGYTGFAWQDGDWLYVRDGTFMSEWTGVVKAPADAASPDNVREYYYIEDGKVNWSATGIARAADGLSSDWYYVENGIYTRATGIAQKADGSSLSWYYVKNGVYTRATGIAQKAEGSSLSWYYVKNGVYTRATGIARKVCGSDKNWYYVKNGVYTRATGIARMADRSSLKWFYVRKGVYTKATGIARKADGSSLSWYYVKNGVYTIATGIARKADGSSLNWYYVRNGVYKKLTCLAAKADNSSTTLYYVQKGVYQNVSGIYAAAYNGKKSNWYIRSGVLQASFSGRFGGYQISKGEAVKKISMPRIAICGTYSTPYSCAYWVEDHLSSAGYNCQYEEIDEDTDISNYDGLIIPGGADVTPSLYGESNYACETTSLSYDLQQMAIIKKFVDAEKPILGICRGLQILNVYFGGTLCQNVSGHQSKHYVYAESGSLMEQLCGQSSYIYSSHHQAIKKLASGFVATQYASDGLIEAIEHKTLPIIATQWHPEKTTWMSTSGQNPVIKYFINEMCYGNY